MADEINKRVNMATNTIIYVTQFLDAINHLNDIQIERSKLVTDFQDSDFTSSTNLNHLTAAQVGVLFDFVLPAFQTTLADTGNSGRNIQILNQIRNR